MSRIRTVLVLFLLVLGVVGVIPLFLFCVLVRAREPIIVYGKVFLRAARLALGIKIQVEGLERLERERAYVFMSNHLSLLDGPLLVMVIPQRIRVIMKKTIFRIPVGGPAMRFVGFVPVDRKKMSGGRKSINEAAALMQQRDYSFLIFPEGTRSRDGRMLPLRRGGFFLAVGSDAPVVPVSIRGTLKLMPKGQWYARSGEVRVVVHEPVPVSGVLPATMPELMEKIRAAIASAV